MTDADDDVDFGSAVLSPTIFPFLHPDVFDVDSDPHCRVQVLSAWRVVVDHRYKIHVPAKLETVWKSVLIGIRLFTTSGSAK